MSKKVEVPVETFHKMVGFIETTKGAFDKQAADSKALKQAAEKTVKNLVDEEFIPAEKSAALVDNLVADPAKAFELITKFAEETKDVRKKVEDLQKVSADKGDEVPSLGEGEEKVASAGHSSRRESDMAWERGFQL
jgi:hypothetical protein